MKNITSIVKRFAEDYDLGFIDDYSGGGMYGETYIGLIINEDVMTELVKLCDYLHEEGVNSVYDALGSIYMDSIALDSIVFFPEIK